MIIIEKSIYDQKFNNSQNYCYNGAIQRILSILRSNIVQCDNVTDVQISWNCAELGCERVSLKPPPLSPFLSLSLSLSLFHCLCFPFLFFPRSARSRRAVVYFPSPEFQAGAKWSEINFTDGVWTHQENQGWTRRVPLESPRDTLNLIPERAERSSADERERNNGWKQREREKERERERKREREKERDGERLKRVTRGWRWIRKFSLLNHG